MKALKILSLCMVVILSPITSFSGIDEGVPVVTYEQSPLLEGTLTARFRGMTATAPFTPPDNVEDVGVEYLGKDTETDPDTGDVKNHYAYQIEDENGRKIGGCTVTHTGHADGTESLDISQVSKPY